MRNGESPVDPPALTQAAQDIGRAGLEAGRSAWSVLAALRDLVAADAALSRSAMGVTAAYAGAAIALGASSWLLLMTLSILVLQALGLAWVWSVAIPTVISVIATYVCFRRASEAFAQTRFEATRRQLSRLADELRDADDEVTTRTAESPPEPRT